MVGVSSMMKVMEKGTGNRKSKKQQVYEESVYSESIREDATLPGSIAGGSGSGSDSLSSDSDDSDEFASDDENFRKNAMAVYKASGKTQTQKAARKIKAGMGAGETADKRLREMFEAIDTDGGGTLDKAELFAVFKSLKMGLTNLEMERAFEEMDEVLLMLLLLLLLL